MDESQVSQHNIENMPVFSEPGLAELPVCMGENVVAVDGGLGAEVHDTAD